MAGFKGLIIGTILILLFSFSLLTFYASWNLANNPSGNMNNNSYIARSLSNINSTFADTQSIASNAMDAASSDTPSIIYIFLIIESAWKTPKMMISIATAGFNMITGLVLVNLFGADNSSTSLVLVLNIIGAILLIVLVFAFIKFVRTGNDER